MRVDEQRGYVLHRYAHGETSVLLEVFTAQFGRVGLIARGVRRPGRAFAGANLRPFQPLLLSWTERGDLGTLVGAEALSLHADLRGNAIWCGFYVNELLLRLLHRHESHPDLYGAYEVVLQALAEQGCQESILRIFEKRMLAALGYGLLLSHDRRGRAIDADARYAYGIGEGPVPVTGNDPINGVPVQGSTLLALSAEKWSDPQQLREAKRLLRALVDELLGDKRLHTRSLFRALRVPPSE
ncbi:MAG: DNA repair protein RecO [Gammaproteobacteria bacterium]|nr:DNA repair protein RecO [Gammaproteobacteria bacterium]